MNDAVTGDQRQRTRISASTVLGAPFVPPAAASEQSNRMRALLRRWQRRLAPPPVQILESALSLLEHRVLVVLCAAGVPEALDEPMPVSVLAGKLGVDAARLERLIRYASAHGWLRLDRRGLIHPTKVTAFLRADHPGGWRAWVDFVGGEHVVGAVAALTADNVDAFADANGSAFFDWMHGRPKEWATFDAAMAAGARMHALMLDKLIDWRTAGTIVDVGGGTGELVRTLLDRHPNLRATVFDLAGVVERAVQHPRLTAVAGDAFVSVPRGHDVYLLVNVLHDWSDEDAAHILTNVAGACGSSSRVLVVENERRSRPRDDLALRADVLMASLTNGGRERTRDEFSQLGQRAGLRLVSSTLLASGDHAFEFTRQPISAG
jgi:hypothetical protein